MVPHSSKGHFVFPKYPLMCGLTASLWSGYAADKRALECLQTVKQAYQDFPLTALGMDDKVFPSMGTEIIRLVHSMALSGDPDTEKYMQWLLKNIPLAGVPEVFTTNGRAVRSWENGEMLALLRDYTVTVK